MSGLRLAVSAALGAAGVVLAMVSPAFAASAAPNITITSAGPDPSGNPYDLTVVADDGNGLPIQAMTAVVSNAAGPVVTVTMAAKSVSNPASQTWAAATPILESALPPGTYTVQVNAMDASENDSALQAPGSFTVTYLTDSLSATASPPAVTQGPQLVTFSGTLTGTAQGSSPVGIANAPVNLVGGTSNPVAKTDSSGNFSYQASGVQPGTYTFSVAGVTGAYPSANSNGVTVTAQQSATTISLRSPTPPVVTEGLQTVTFAGSVSVTPPPPAAQNSIGIGSGVQVYLNGAPTVPPTVTTDANGDFSYTATDVQPGTYTFSVLQSPLGLYSAASNSAAVTASTAPTTLSVKPSPAVITFGSPSVVLSGTVTALPAGNASAVAVPNAPVYLNGSASPVATTDANGSFSYNATGITQSTTDTFSVNASQAGLYSGASDAVPVNVDPGTTAMTVTANPPDINLATSKVTFTGTVSVTPFGSTTPEGGGSGIPVYLSVGGGAASQVTTTNDANGDFSYTATGVKKAADYDFSVNSTTLSAAASKSVPIGQNQVQSTLTVTPAPASVTEGSQTVTFTGQLTGVSPSGGPAVGIQNAPVDLSINGKPATQVKTTDVNGDFTYTVTGVSQKTAYAFSVASSPTYTQATDNITVVVNQARTRISHIRVTPAHLKYGQNATLSATVQYLNGTTWTALPRTAVHLAEGKTRLKTVTTARNGTFTATLPSTHGTGWTAVVNAGKLILQTAAMGNLSIALPLEVSSFSAQLGVDDKITARGCLEVLAPIGEGPGTFVDIQYSGTAHGPWRSLGTLPLNNDVGRSRTCRSHDQSFFRGTLPAKLANAYYRADFAATYSYQAAISNVVHAWKYPTRIVSFTANKHSISKNGTVRFRGRLEVRVKSWRPWGGQSVTIWYNYQGTSIFVELTAATTNSRGYFTASAAGTTGNFVAINYALYAGNARHLACLSKGVVVRISNDGTSAVAAAAAAAPPLDLPELDRLPPLAVPLLPAFTAWPSITSLARTEP